MHISDNLLKALLKNVYFINGTAYAGKSTTVRMLAERHGGVHCGENYHDMLMHLIDRAHQPNLSYFDTMSGWDEFLSRTPEEYAAWIDGTAREAAELEVLRLIQLSSQDKPVFVDTNIPPELLHRIASDGHVLIMLSPQRMSVERFFDRDDPEKRFLLDRLMAMPDPDAAMANFRACLMRINRKEAYDAMANSGFPVHVRAADTTIGQAVAFAEKTFRLTHQDKLLARYRAENREAVPGQILFTGSSLMEQFPVHLWAKELPDAPIVYNRSVGGFRTEDMLQNLDAMAIELRPRRMIVNIGTNDLSDPRVTIPDLMARCGEILDRVKQAVPGVELILLAYYPINRDAATDEGMRRTLSIRTNERIAQANRAVAELAQACHARFLNLNAPLTDDQGRLKAEFTTEGMHITHEGYRAIWDEVVRTCIAD